MSASWQSWSGAETRAHLGKTPIAVVMGGASAEREVSMTSGGAISRSLKDLSGPSDDVAPPIFDVEIDAAGAWCLDGAALSPQQTVEALPADTIYLLALHGGAGEDGRIQAFLQTAGRHHTGAGPATSSLCMDKHRSRLIAADAGVAVADGAFVTKAAYVRDRAAGLARLAKVASPVTFVKHASAGSSFGVFRCTSAEEVERAADEIAASGGDILVEAEIRGLETTCGLIGDGADAAALPVVEIVPTSSTFFDHAQKYNASGGATETCPPIYLPDAVAARIQDRARTAWDVYGGTGYARIDFMVPCRTSRSGERQFDEDVEPVLLEANTLPGFTPRSLLPLAASADGVGFRELCLELAARATAG